MVDMSMQQLAAAPPRVMSQVPEIKYANEPGKLATMLMREEACPCVCTQHQVQRMKPQQQDTQRKTGKNWVLGMLVYVLVTLPVLPMYHTAVVPLGAVPYDYWDLTEERFLM